TLGLRPPRSPKEPPDERRCLRTLGPEGRGGRASWPHALLFRQARLLFRPARRDAAPARRPGLFHIFLGGAAAAPARKTAGQRSKRLDVHRRRGRLPRPQLPFAFP